MIDTSLDRYVRQLPKSSISICVGARDGGSIARLAALGPGHCVLAFELDPQKCERLRRRFRGRPSIEIENIALMERGGELQFFGLPGGSSLGGTAARLRGSSAFTVAITRLVSLDEYCRERGLGEIALLKVDTRTFAREILNGAAALLDGQRIGAVTFKALPVRPHDDGVAPWELSCVMAASGYRLAGVDTVAWSPEAGVEYRDPLYLPALCHSPKKEIL